MTSNHKGEEPVGWVTVKGVHFPKWKDGTIGWNNGEEKLSSHSQHDFQKAIREAKTKEDISKIIKEAGNSGLSEEAMNKVMGTAYDRGQELKESTQSKSADVKATEAILSKEAAQGVGRLKEKYSKKNTTSKNAKYDTGRSKLSKMSTEELIAAHGQFRYSDKDRGYTKEDVEKLLTEKGFVYKVGKGWVYKKK